MQLEARVCQCGCGNELRDESGAPDFTGKRFFSDGTPPRELALVSTKAVSSGVIISTYRPNGPLRTGTMGD